MSARCKWGGCFVARAAEPTTRSVHGVEDGVLAWRTYTQLLCPPCKASWSTDTAWNRAVGEHPS